VPFPHSGDRKLTLDEPSFQKLLGAAYALQENKDLLRAGSSEQDSASVFTQIAALRSQILGHLYSAELKVVATDTQSKPRPPAEAAALVADALRRLTKADGASVCLIVDGYLRPAACSGRAAKVSGGSVASNSLVATERLRNCRAFQSANACSDIRLGPSLCVDLQIGSLLAFPIERKNEIAGLIEVRWTKADAFTDGDERICQLMADLMDEVLEAEDSRVNASVTHPVPVTGPGRAVAEVATPVEPSKPRTQEEFPAPAPAAPVASSDQICRVCGKPLTSENSVCGSCGMVPAASDNSLQGKWASMWFMQQAQKVVEAEEARGERLWPLRAASTLDSNSGGTAESASLTESSLQTVADQSDGTPSEQKRSPRGVLAILKSRMRARAMGQ
jgi:hypothetical protein